MMLISQCIRCISAWSHEQQPSTARGCQKVPWDHWLSCSSCRACLTLPDNAQTPVHCQDIRGGLSARGRSCVERWGQHLELQGWQHPTCPQIQGLPCSQSQMLQCAAHCQAQWQSRPSPSQAAASVHLCRQGWLSSQQDLLPGSKTVFHSLERNL